MLLLVIVGILVVGSRKVILGFNKVRFLRAMAEFGVVGV